MIKLSEVDVAKGNYHANLEVDIKSEIKSLRRINKTLSMALKEQTKLADGLSKINEIKNGQLEILRDALIKGDSASIPLIREKIMSIRAALSSVPQIEQSAILRNVAARGGGLKNSTKLRAICRLVNNSGYYDELYYLENNPDVLKSGQDPLRHFVKYGGSEGRKPSEKFDAQYYLYSHSDVREAGVNPLVHYLLWGKLEGRFATADEQKKLARKAGELGWYYESKDRWRQYQKDYNYSYSADNGNFHKTLNKLKNVTIYPLSYPIEITQRPQHVLKSMNILNNRTSIILDFSAVDADPYFNEIEKNMYITNRVVECIDYFRHRENQLYITYPFYSFLVSLLRPEKTIYDVIDSLECFSGPLEGLRQDHKYLLGEASVITYSSQVLMEKDQGATIHNKKILLGNGTWAKDFVIDNPSQSFDKRESKKEYVVGYYGAISNLLDWGLLENVTKIEGVRLVMIGPIVDFENGDHEINDQRGRVLRAQSVTHIKSVPYEDLPAYSYFFDAAIVPFAINEITDAVSPLKMYEYMAAGHEIFATRTKTLLDYEGIVSVLDNDEILSELKARTRLPIVNKEYYRARYEAVLKGADWLQCVKQLTPLLNRASDRAALNIDILNVNFYDWKGETLYKGGAERYVFDLAKIIKDLGHKPRILQNAYEGFEKKYMGIDVVGVVSGDNTMRSLSKKYKEVCSNSDLVITSPLDLSCELGAIPSIGINHGIHWDSNTNNIYTHRTEKYKEVFDALIQVENAVCVDTNFINWTRTYDYELAGKLKFVPNYYDSNDFKPKEKDFTGPLTFVYPRRLYEARGITITLKVFDELLYKYKDASLLLVGQTDDPQMKRKINQVIRRHPNQIGIEEYPMEEMPIAYTKGQVVLVPTLYAEGTSLSCIEAMATNNVVIASNIGGLSNLIIDRHNGLLIEPTEKNLKEAVEEVIGNRLLAASLATTARSMVGVFDKGRWDNKWRQILHEAIKE